MQHSPIKEFWLADADIVSASKVSPSTAYCAEIFDEFAAELGQEIASSEAARGMATAYNAALWYLRSGVDRDALSTVISATMQKARTSEALANPVTQRGVLAGLENALQDANGGSSAEQVDAMWEASLILFARKFVVTVQHGL